MNWFKCGFCNSYTEFKSTHLFHSWEHLISCTSNRLPHNPVESLTKLSQSWVLLWWWKLWSIWDLQRIGEDAKRFLKNRRRNSGASMNVQLKLIRLRGSFLASKGPSIVSATSSSLVVVSIATLPSLLQSKMQVEQTRLIRTQDNRQDKTRQDNP